MANPMQKKSRNSFILGVLVTLVIMGLVVALLLMQIMKLKEAENERNSSLVSVSVLNSDVKSGDAVDGSMFKTVQADKSTVPTDAIKASSLDENTIAKIDLKKGTVLTDAMVTATDENVTNDLRIQEYNMINIQSQITSNDYVDIRLRMPSGLDYVVVSKKKVEVPQIDGIDSVNTIWVKLTEEETLAMSNAIVEAYQMDGSYLYTTKYVEPGTQGKATPTYVPSQEVINLVQSDPNIVQEAKNAMITRYNTYAGQIRNSINGELNRVESDDRTDGISSGVSKEVSTRQEQRQSYLDALAGE